MDQDEELAKFKWLLIAVIIFLGSGYFSYKELKFAVWGATAEARVSETFATRNSSRRRSRPLLAVKYSFTDEDGNQFSERDDVPIDWPVSENMTVQYLPGVEDSSRLLGHSSWLAVCVFLASLGLLGFAGYGLYKEATEAVHGKRPGRK